MRIALALASLAVALAACGDNLAPGGQGPDASETDAATDATTDAPLDANCPARAQGTVGGPCTADAQCDTAAAAGDGVCLNTAASSVVLWPAEGYCVTKVGTCTADVECGAGNVCAILQDPLGDFSACMPACASDSCICPNNQLCGNNFAGSMIDKNVCLPGNASAIDGDRCAGFGECDESSLCRADSLEFPGGQCMQLGCTIGNDATCTSGGDGRCIDPGFLSEGTGCADTCLIDADCRLSEGYRCFDAGPPAGKYCRHPQTGDACTTDASCGDPTRWSCKTGVTYPGGYCTVRAACDATDGSGCSPGSSICYAAGLPAPYCVDRCTGAGQGTCRVGYQCTALPVFPGNPASSGCL